MPLSRLEKKGAEKPYASLLLTTLAVAKRNSATPSSFSPQPPCAIDVRLSWFVRTVSDASHHGQWYFSTKVGWSLVQCGIVPDSAREAFMVFEINTELR